MLCPVARCAMPAVVYPASIPRRLRNRTAERASLRLRTPSNFLCLSPSPRPHRRWTSPRDLCSICVHRAMLQCPLGFWEKKTRKTLPQELRFYLLATRHCYSAPSSLVKSKLGKLCRGGALVLSACNAACYSAPSGFVKTRKIRHYSHAVVRWPDTTSC